LTRENDKKFQCPQKRPSTTRAGDWTQDVTVARQVLLPLNPLLHSFWIGYFWDRVLLYAQASLDHDSSICASPCSWDDRHMSSSKTFCQGWPQIVILPNSASQVARITGLSTTPGIVLFIWYWVLNSGPAPWATPPVLFCDGFFHNRVSRTICPAWLWTTILLLSAFWVVRITGVSHQRPACFCFLRQYPAR
jgi:hypothetical protein